MDTRSRRGQGNIEPRYRGSALMERRSRRRVTAGSRILGTTRLQGLGGGHTESRSFGRGLAILHALDSFAQTVSSYVGAAGLADAMARQPVRLRRSPTG